MAELLIAYNNDLSDGFSDVFEACADKAKELCRKHSVKCDEIMPPKLTSYNVCSKISNYKMLFIAAHGDNDGIYNEKDEDDEVVTTHTTNYDFKDKGFYSVSCNAANNLSPELKRIGLLLFVGYDDKFWVQGDVAPFCECALAGLDRFLSGDTVAEAKQKMYEVFNTKIKELEMSNKLAAKWLTHNKVHLCFEGRDELTINDLK